MAALGQEDTAGMVDMVWNGSIRQRRQGETRFGRASLGWTGEAGVTRRGTQGTVWRGFAGMGRCGSIGTERHE